MDPVGSHPLRRMRGSLSRLSRLRSHRRRRRWCSHRWVHRKHRRWDRMAPPQWGPVLVLPVDRPRSTTRIIKPSARRWPSRRRSLQGSCRNLLLLSLRAPLPHPWTGLLMGASYSLLPRSNLAQWTARRLRRCRRIRARLLLSCSPLRRASPPRRRPRSAPRRRFHRFPPRSRGHLWHRLRSHPRRFLLHRSRRRAPARACAPRPPAKAWSSHRRPLRIAMRCNG